MSKTNKENYTQLTSTNSEALTLKSFKTSFGISSLLFLLIVLGTPNKNLIAEFGVTKRTVTESVVQKNEEVNKKHSNSQPTMESPYNGRDIRKIVIHLSKIFNKKPLGAIYRTINKLKIATREQVIRRELIINEKSKYSEFAIWESKRNLRTLPFLREIDIKAEPVGADMVDVHVYAQDAWTLVPQFGASNSGGSKSSSIGLSESDFLGLGKSLKFLYREKDNRQAVDFSWQDPRVWGTLNNFSTAFTDRNDGEEFSISLTKPFRSLLNRVSWSASLNRANIVGRIFEFGDESSIYKLDTLNLRTRYTFALGNPEILLRRISFGIDVLRSSFTTANDGDFDALNLDPNEVTSNQEEIPEDRINHGLFIGYRSITPDFIPMSYIDRFDRTEDYNLGAERSLTMFFAPDLLGSRENTLEFTFNRSGGLKFSKSQFLRAEVGGSTRFTEKKPENSLIRGEIKYFNVLGGIFAGDTFLGSHTIAFQSFIDYGNDFYNDRQLLAGNEQGALRGYRARAFQGDKRYAINLEDRMFLVEDLFRLVSLGAATFVDIGGATEESLGRLFTDNTYADVGVGLRLGFPRSSGGSVVRLDLSVPLRNGPDGTAQFEPRITATAGQAFGARLTTEVTGFESANTIRGFGR